MVFDPIIDVREKRILLEEIIEYIFKTDNISYMKGKNNIKYDMILNNCYQSGKSIPCELKTRWSNYRDVAVEITQYQRTSDGYKDRLYDGWKKGEIIQYLKTCSGAGWLFKSKATAILYITQDHIDVINFPEMRKYMFDNFNSLEDKYCGATTGSYNKIIKYNDETKKFINRIETTEIRKVLDELYI